MKRVLSASLCVALATLAGCAKLELSADDAIIGFRGRTLLVAHVERHFMPGMPDGVEGVQVEFLAAGRRVGTAITDRHGSAALEYLWSDECGDSFTAVTKGLDSADSASGRLCRLKPERSVIVVDIDKTICATDRDHLYLRASDDSPPMAGAREVLSTLAKDYEIVYLTARPHFLAEKSRVWLAVHCFPHGPLLMARSWRASLRQERYKRSALARLRQHLPNVLIGIGDKQLDARAYAWNHMLGIHFGGTQPETADQRIVALKDWQEIGRFFEANRSVLVDPDRLRELLERDTAPSVLIRSCDVPAGQAIQRD